MTVGEALEMAFPDCEIKRRTVYLTETQQSGAGELARVELKSVIIYPYVAMKEGLRRGRLFRQTYRAYAGRNDHGGH